MAGQFYKRVWRVVAYQAKGFTPNDDNPTHFDFFERQPNTIEIDAMRVQFDIKKGVEKQPNSCELTITNLNKGTRLSLSKNPLIVWLEAGWEDNGGAKFLFGGDLRYGYSKQDGPDWSTVLQLADGGRAYQQARLSRSYKAGTATLTALRDAAKAMGLTLPRNVEADPALRRGFENGASLHGDAQSQMTKLLNPYGYSWSIQSGRLVILKDEEVDTNRALIISADTGMIGSPEFGQPEKKKKTPQLKIKTLLYPQVNPGTMLSVQAKEIRGIFRVEKVNHKGDSHGDDWTTEIDARAVNVKPT